MADEITSTMKLSIENGSYKETFNPGRMQIDQTGQGASSGIITVGTTEEALAPTDITTEGCLIIQNCSTVNFVTYGPEDGTAMVDFGRVKAGEVASLRLEPGVTLRWKADSTACNVYYLLLED